MLIRLLLVADADGRPNLYSLLQPGTYLPLAAVGKRSPLFEGARRRESKVCVTDHATGPLEDDPFRAQPQIEFFEEPLTITPPTAAS